MNWLVKASQFTLEALGFPLLKYFGKLGGGVFRTVNLRLEQLEALMQQVTANVLAAEQAVMPNPRDLFAKLNKEFTGLKVMPFDGDGTPMSVMKWSVNTE